MIRRVSDNAYIDFNQQFAMSGYTPQDINDSRTQLERFKDTTQQAALRERVLAEGVVRNVEVDFLTPDGQTKPTMLSAVRIDLDGEDCVVTMIRDLTAVKEASRKIEESAKSVRDIFDVSPDAISVSRVSDGHFVECNDEFLHLTGYTREQVMGSSVLGLEVFADSADRLQLAAALARDGVVRNLEIELRTANHAIVPTLISAAMINLGSELCVVTYIRDITEIKQIECELVGAREAALAASRAKSEFLSSMSHEIRTPMNAILGMADLLAESELDDEQRRYVNTVVSNGNALLELINGILDLAKVESGRISLEAVEFDPREVTEKVVETLSIRAREKGLELVTLFASDVPAAAIGDPLRLGQILINLIANAIKFTPSGQVQVSIERDQTFTTAGGLKFSVTDTGIGIPADKLHLLFQAFTQADSSTSRKYGGSGLGLAIVSRLVALMHGRVEVASDFGKGSCFSFTAQFGIAPARPALSGARERALAEIPLSTTSPSADRPLHILIVDDSFDNRALIEAYLKKTPYRVEEAEDGQQAIDKFKTGRFDLVLMDIQMPVVDGYEATKTIRGWERENGRRRTPVVALTASALEDAADRSIAAGCDAHVTKPVKKSTLLEAIRDAVKENPLADDHADLADLKENTCRTE